MKTLIPTLGLICVATWYLLATGVVVLIGYLPVYVGGLGVVLAPPLLTIREMHPGALTALPGYDPVEIGTYSYLRRPESRVVRQFCSWLDAEMRALE